MKGAAFFILPFHFIVRYNEDNQMLWLASQKQQEQSLRR